MTGFALALVLLSALLHATWNLLAKRSGGGVPFVWLSDLISIGFYGPIALAVYLIERPYLGWLQFLFIVVSSMLHLGYFVLLMRGYRAGDLSLVYPLARGTGPVLSTLAAIAFFGERPGPVAIAGAFLVAVGVFLLAGGPRAGVKSGARTAVVYGLLTGAVIAVYTLWDKQAVGPLMVPPVLYFVLAGVARITILTPYIGGHWGEVRREWATNRIEVLGLALFSPLSYILVLTALAFTPVSYVAPAREVSILIGAIMGARLLSEGDAGRRLLASCAVVAGITALALG
ncbi:MAG TPA: DMT family transporter [Chloroflexia bacterium]|nr:DMT family transporter [Chloroflexia bacterium]